MATRGQPVYGEFEDAGRYYRCRNCGFICDTQRDYETPVSVREVIYNPAYLLLENGDYFLKEDGGKLILENQIGEATTEYQDLTIGCPFCGVANYR